MKLNLGCSDRTLPPPWINVDICPPADMIADLSQGWPWADSSVSEVAAFDVFEHLPDKKHTLEELYRVLKPSGKATIEVPCAAHGAGAFQDCGHVSYWTGNDFEYVEKGNYARERFRNNPLYPNADFRIESATHTKYQGKFDEVFKFRITLVAIK